MFNFTTQTVLNHVTVQEEGQAKTANANVFKGTNEVRVNNIKFYKQDSNNPYIYLDGKPTVISIEKHLPYAEHLTKIVFDMSKVSDPGIYRIALYLGLSQNSQEAFYSNDLVYKGKPMYIEFAKLEGESANDLAAKVVTIAKKYMLFTTQQTLLNVSASGANVTFEGVNGYQQIKLAYLQMYDPEAVKIDCCSNDGEFINMLTGVPVIFKIEDGTVTPDTTKAANGTKEGRALTDTEIAIEPGVEAFGDYNWLIHNLRLPTGANTSYFHSVNKEEMPAVGQTYAQFIVRLLTNRDGIGQGAVGQRVTSVTTHVFWVPENKASEFEAVLQVVKAGDPDTSADDAFAAGQAGPQ